MTFRYRAETNAPGPGACVVLDGPAPSYPRVIAETATLRDAEVIATALNSTSAASDEQRAKEAS